MENDAMTVLKYENYIKRRIAESWCIEQEQILQMWAEKASGWAWLHDKAARHYNSASNKLMYPTLVIATTAGGVGLVMVGNSCLNSYAKYIEYLVAGSHIICSTLTSLNRYLRSNEKAEIHMHMNKSFSSFARKIVLELTLNPEDRRDAIEFCKACRDEYDKLVTDSLLMPGKVIHEFKEKYRDAKHKPEVCNGLIHFTNYYDIKNDTPNFKLKVMNSSENAFHDDRRTSKDNIQLPLRREYYNQIKSDLLSSARRATIVGETQEKESKKVKRVASANHLISNLV